jgi:hypothetical protein
VGFRILDVQGHVYLGRKNSTTECTSITTVTGPAVLGAADVPSTPDFDVMGYL